jgi:hypothetical protein
VAAAVRVAAAVTAAKARTGEREETEGIQLKGSWMCLSLLLTSFFRNIFAAYFQLHLLLQGDFISRLNFSDLD